MIIRQIRILRTNGKADGDGAERLSPLPGEGWVWVTKRRTVKDAGTSEQKSRNNLHADGNGAERLGPLQGEGWVWVTERRTVRDAGTSEQKKPQ